MDYNVISADDHLQEPRDLWTRRLSKTKWGNRIPEVRSYAAGQDAWYIWDQPYINWGYPVLASVMGLMENRRRPLTWEEVPAKSYVPAERIKAMDQDGVDVHTFFGNITGIAGNTFSNPKFADIDFRLDCIRAYNDFQIDEFATPYPGRFITLAIVPMWDVNQAVAEAQRMARRGVKGISFAFPQQFDYPHVADNYWNPLWAFIQEAELPLCFHIGGGAGMGINAAAYVGNSPTVQAAERATRTVSSNVDVMTTLLFSGILERFPRLKVVSSESGLGWAPYLLETADHHWLLMNLAKHGMPLAPSEYFRRQCYVTFWFESLGLKVMKSTFGVDNVMWSSDFPHTTGLWPESRSYIKNSIETAGLNAIEARKVLVDNAKNVFHF